MSEKEEKKVEVLPKEDAQKAKEVEKKVEELTAEEELKQLKTKNTALETLVLQLKANIPNILKIGRPIHLNLVHKGFIYQLLIPEHAITDISQFADSHAMLSKFGVLLSEMETNSINHAKQLEIAKAKAEAEKVAKKEK